jgi:hypothetical protein
MRLVINEQTPTARADCGLMVNADHPIGAGCLGDFVARPMRGASKRNLRSSRSSALSAALSAALSVRSSPPGVVRRKRLRPGLGGQLPAQFDAVFQAEEIEIIKTRIRAPHVLSGVHATVTLRYLSGVNRYARILTTVTFAV